MKRTAKKAFTLVEILIVVIILGILAAIVIPQFTQASTQARLSNLETNLQTVRSQMLLYKVQHNEKYPTTLSTQLVQYSDISGGVATAPDSTHTFGPYLQAVPINPISQLGCDPRSDGRRDGLLGPVGGCRLVLQLDDRRVPGRPDGHLDDAERLEVQHPLAAGAGGAVDLALRLR